MVRFKRGVSFGSLKSAFFLQGDVLRDLWFFCKGKGENAQFVPAEEIGPALVRAYGSAQAAGVLIDNVEIVKSQVFSLPGTRFDLSNAAWQSLAVGPDGQIYPSPALIGDAAMASAAKAAPSCRTDEGMPAQAWLPLSPAATTALMVPMVLNDALTRLNAANSVTIVLRATPA